MSQLDLFGSIQQALPQPDPAAVRARVHQVLARLREADVMPLTEKELRFWRTIMPQTTNWLPAEEKAAACAEFEEHITRLGSKAA